VPPDISGIFRHHAQKTAATEHIFANLVCLLTARPLPWRDQPDIKGSTSQWKAEAIMKIRINGLMKMAAALASIALGATILVVNVPARAGTDDFDAAGTYKSKCVACHGAKAEKKFDATLSDDDMVQAVLKGKKPEKPPNMPAFEERGITADQAKAMVAYMKSIK
jgi:Cytochrome c553